jgi:hypothetical protein
MVNEDLQYYSATVLIEKTIKADPALLKQAGLLDQFGIDSLGSTIKGLVHDAVGKYADKPGGAVTAVLTLLANGVLFRINPLLWILSQILSHFGFDISDVISSIVEKVSKVLESKGTISADEVNSIGKEVVRATAGPLGSESGDDMLGYLRQIHASGEINDSIKTAGPKIPFFGEKGGSLLEKIFGRQLLNPRGRGKLKWLAGGLVVWTIKTALLAALLLTGVAAVKGLVGLNKKPEKDQTDTTQDTATQETKPETKPTTNTFSGILVPKGGTKRWQNTREKPWYGIVSGDGLEDTVVGWTDLVYPNLKKEFGGYNNLYNFVISLPKFDSVLYELEANVVPETPSEFRMPPKYHSIKQVVDTFAGEIAKHILQNKNKVK